MKKLFLLIAAAWIAVFAFADNLPVGYSPGDPRGKTNNLDASGLINLPSANLVGTPPANYNTNNATQLSSGTVADARLSANVSLLNTSNAFTKGISIASNLSYETASGKQIILASSNIDASTGSIFFRQLAGNTPFALTGMTDGTTISLAVANAGTFVTTYTGFTFPSNAITPLPTPGTCVLTVVRINGTNMTTVVTNFP